MLRRLMHAAIAPIAALACCAVPCAVGRFAAPLAAEEPTREQIDFFEKKIRPVLAAQCYECHSRDAKEIQGGLTLDSREGLLMGGDSGPAVVPGDPDESLLIDALRYTPGSFEMPPAGKLPAAVIADFERWVKVGAPAPRDKPDQRE